jgi:hypothetical protein
MRKFFPKEENWFHLLLTQYKPDKYKSWGVYADFLSYSISSQDMRAGMFCIFKHFVLLINEMRELKKNRI